MLDRELVHHILEELTNITVATCGNDGQPWNTPVFAAYDSRYRFYWTSRVESRHSINISRNRKVFIAVYDACGNISKGRGVYVEAEAEELADPTEITTARKLLQDRKGQSSDGPEGYLEPSRLRVYRATPKQAWINQAEVKDGVFSRDYRVKIEL